MSDICTAQFSNLIGLEKIFGMTRIVRQTEINHCSMLVEYIDNFLCAASIVWWPNIRTASSPTIGTYKRHSWPHAHNLVFPFFMNKFKHKYYLLYKLINID